MSQNKDIKTMKIAAVLILTSTALAATAQDNVTASGDSTNWLELLLIISSVVLLFVIWLLSQVLITLSKSILKKRKSEMTAKVISIAFLSTIISKVVDAQDYIVTGMKEDKGYGGMHPIEFYALAAVIGIELIVILFLSYMVKRAFKDLSGEDEAKLSKSKTSIGLLALWKSLDQKFMTRAVPVEQEADVLLDHDYDGIKELDNALPPWWKYGFYITVVIGIVYLFYFHVMGIGLNPEQEYNAEMEEGKKQEEIYKAKTKDLIDENNITMADASGIDAGKSIYITTCVPCHGAKGEGGIGPNLTDEYWLHGGSMNNIYKTIKLGYPEKGMQSWQAMFSPIQMQNLASFVKSLKGTNPPNGKAPQGEIYKEETGADAVSADSAAAPTSSPK